MIDGFLRRRSAWVVVLSAVVLVMAGIALAAHLHSSPSPGGAAARTTVPYTGAPKEPEAPLPARSDPSEQAALEAARGFLTGFVPYSYGQVPPSAIRDAAGPLAASLARRPPRVLASQRAAQPRLRGLHVIASNGDLGIDVAATIDDGQRTYTFTVSVRPRANRWRVVAVA